LIPNIYLVVLALAPLAAVELAKTERWRSLFGARRPPYAQALRALLAGQLTNSLMPLRAGDAVSLGVLKAEGGGLVAGAGALAGIKAIDALVLAGIAGAVVGRAALAHAWWSTAAGAAALLLCAALVLQRARFRSLVERFSWGRKLRLAALADVLDALHHPPTLATVLVTTALAWTLGLVANGVILAAVGIAPDLHLAARVIVAGYVLNVVPAPPAGIGLFEAGITVALTSAGVPLPQALLAAVTLHVCQFVKLGLLMAASLLLTRRQSWLRWTRWLRPA
jgi:uncharacterized membrane protein YbhN (UPF0104 family)